MAQVNAAENVITHERTIYLDTAADLKILNWSGWYLRILKVSSALVSIEARIDNEQTEAKTLQLGAGWRHRYFEKLALSWTAQPGEWITVEYGGNPLTYRPGEYESFVPSSVSAVEVSNTTAQAVPITGSVTVTQSTSPWTVNDDQTPVLASNDMPAGATTLSISSGTWYSTTAKLIYTVPVGKIAVVKNMVFAGALDRPGHVWIDDGAGTELWRRACNGNSHLPLPKPIQMAAGQRLYGIGYSNSMWCVAAGYIANA